jgi:hypothetical protein
MRPNSWTTLIAASLTVLVACAESDVRNTRPDRTRSADGIIKLYGNRLQGDWMLKGKVVQVEAAVVTEVVAKRREIVVTGRESLVPIPMTIRLHSSEKTITRIVPGDLLTFKGVCRGLDGTIQFESCVILSLLKPSTLP